MSRLWLRSIVLLLSCATAALAQQPSPAPQSPASLPQLNAPVNSQPQPPDVQTSKCPVPQSNRNATSTLSTAVTSGDWVELRRTRCYGSCPAYTVRLGADGSVRWRGEQFVANEGNAIAQVDAPQAAALIQQLLDYGFRSLCGSYSRPITDSSTFITTANVAYQVIQVSDYADSAPSWLRDFDNRIDAVADTHRWRHGDPANELFGDTHLAQDARMSKPGRNQMMRFAASGDHDGIQLLLDKHVPVDAEDASGWTALMYAAGAGPLPQVRQLLAAGASASHPSRAGETLLFAALSSYDNTATRLQLLQRAGANIAATTSDGTTVLMVAASHYWQPGVIKALLALGADPSLRNKAGKTALDLLEQAHGRQGAPAAEYTNARALLAGSR